MTPDMQDPNMMFNQASQFKEYRKTQRQLSSELKDIMGQLSERAIHQESNLNQDMQEIVSRSARYKNGLDTKRSKRSTSGRSTSAGVTLDESTREKINQQNKQSFVTQESKRSVNTGVSCKTTFEHRSGSRTPGTNVESTKNKNAQLKVMKITGKY